MDLTDFFDVGLGGDMTAAYESEEWAEAYKAGEKKVISCCPAFVNMVRLHYPDLADCVSTTVSPMCSGFPPDQGKRSGSQSRYLSDRVSQRSLRLWISRFAGNADYVLTYSEIRAIMKAKSVVLAAGCRTMIRIVIHLR